MTRSVGTWRDAGHAAICLDEIPQFVGIEFFIPDEDHGLGQKRQQLFGGCRFGALAGEEEQSNHASPFINCRGELGIVPAFGKPNGLSLRSSDGTLAGLVDFDEGAVHRAEAAFWPSRKQDQNLGPNASIYPAAPTAVNRVPTSQLRRKCPPPAPLSQDVKNSLEDIIGGKWRSSNSSCFLYFPQIRPDGFKLIF
jgi:hypothetical protein